MPNNLMQFGFKKNVSENLAFVKEEHDQLLFVRHMVRQTAFRFGGNLFIESFANRLSFFCTQQILNDAIAELTHVILCDIQGHRWLWAIQS